MVLCLLVDRNNSLFRGGGKEVRREDDVEELVTVATVVVFIICQGGIIEDVGVGLVKFDEGGTLLGVLWVVVFLVGLDGGGVSLLILDTME